MKELDFIKSNDFKFKKKYGQNFILDSNILKKIVDSASIKTNTLVIEIGCGAGGLTKLIKEKTNLFIGYEIDKDLEPILSTIDSNIIYDDFLKREIKKDIKSINYGNLIIIGNLPYYITTPIISKIINENLNIDEMIIMVQKEVGDRFLAEPNSKNYGSLTIYLNYYFNIIKLFDVSRNVFIPKPNVDSVVLKLEKRKELQKIDDLDLFFKLIKDSFRQRRKTLKNNLKEYNYKIIKEVLKSNDFEDSVRAEQIPIEVYVRIVNKL